jgi:hypothetical protein
MRIPHCLYGWLTDGSKVVSLTCRPTLYSPETLFFCFWYSFLSEADKSQGLVRPEGFGKSKQIIHINGSRTRDLPFCSTVPEPLRYRVLPYTENMDLVETEVRNDRAGEDHPYRTAAQFHYDRPIRARCFVGLGEGDGVHRCAYRASPGESGGMRIGTRIRNISRKPWPAPLCTTNPTLRPDAEPARPGCEPGTVRCMKRCVPFLCLCCPVGIASLATVGVLQAVSEIQFRNSEWGQTRGLNVKLKIK